ncbi:hypothetical protein MPSEU_000128900 [Mayamaea pseudoterrestris]|nr:hypothetical protein MPSEU_000128900 [Mayamaea pseudoterrestris]
MSVSRPIVILAGWLGCQPRSLRRYEEFYRRRNMQVLSYIAPPSAVFECTLPYYTTSIKSQAEALDKGKYEINQLVEQMLDDLRASNCTSYVFHCFSNGGCFVWEAFRKATTMPPVGVIMDSCPGFELHRITMAFEFCTWMERLQVLWRYGNYYWKAHNHTKWEPHVKARADEYLHNLRDDPWLVPQLFLYSKDDPLMPYQQVAKLAQARKERGAFVTEKVWDHSRHCAHYIDHSKEYEQSVDAFLQGCQPSQHARL